MARKGKPVKAVSYLRTSSSANVGQDKDSDKRQRATIAAFAKRAGYEIVDEFYDPAVRGEDEIEQRPGFAALLDRIENNGVRTVIIEDVSRFARKLLTQELGIIALAQRGVTVLTATGDDLTNTEDEMKVFIRQVAGAFGQLEKAWLVLKLRSARGQTGRDH
jgi:DNA invertase Pin-like site-specific DNA recombinase